MYEYFFIYLYSDIYYFFDGLIFCWFCEVDYVFRIDDFDEGEVGVFGYLCC